MQMVGREEGREKIERRGEKEREKGGGVEWGRKQGWGRKGWQNGKKREGVERGETEVTGEVGVCVCVCVCGGVT